MAILHVANLGRPVLREKASAVEKTQIQQPEFQIFLDDLLASLQFHDGVGLAAPQVFVSKRIIAVQIPLEMNDKGEELEPTVFINPELSFQGKEIVYGWEGCLSLRDLRGIVPRYPSIRLEALDRHGQKVRMKLSGFAARVIQHEVDHLDGIVFLDRMDDLTTLGFSKDLRDSGAFQRDGD